MSEIPVHFLQFYDTFTQKYHKYRLNLRYLCNIKIFSLDNIDR